MAVKLFSVFGVRCQGGEIFSQSKRTAPLWDFKIVQFVFPNLVKNPSWNIRGDIFYTKGGKKFLAKANTMEKKIQTQNSLAKGGYWKLVLIGQNKKILTKGRNFLELSSFAKSKIKWLHMWTKILNIIANSHLSSVEKFQFTSYKHLRINKLLTLFKFHIFWLCWH
jgi:viroplasmin and RNaseH domain-containing protein